MQTINKAITATYELHDITTGEAALIESSPAEKPLQFITGLGMFPVKAFETLLENTAEGEQYELTLQPEEAFGPRFDDRVMDVDVHAFSEDGNIDASIIYPGAVVPMQNEAGQTFLGVVAEVTAEVVKVDFNHPLAGKTLHFKGTVVESREATQEEIDALTQHHCHCGGGCHGNCGDGGCEGGCNHEDGHECHCGGDCNHEEGHECGCGGDCHCKD